MGSGQYTESTTYGSAQWGQWEHSFTVRTHSQYTFQVQMTTNSYSLFTDRAEIREEELIQTAGLSYMIYSETTEK
jgi:hypothetical protein